MKNRIQISYSSPALVSLPITMNIRRCIDAALQAEKVPVPCEINVLITDDPGIRAINLASRQVDRPTDVLSFPMFPFRPEALPKEIGRASCRERV